jgi:hypothetical protein
MHHQCLFAHCQYIFGVIPVKGHNRRLVYYNFVVIYYEGVSSTQVNGYLLRKKIKKSHVFSVSDFEQDIMGAKLK